MRKFVDENSLIHKSLSTNASRERIVIENVYVKVILNDAVRICL
jgi:hypothetical protein